MQDTSRQPPSWRPRFGLNLVFLVTAVICVAAAAGSYLVRGEPFHFLLFVLSAPLLLTVALSTFVAVLHWINRRAK